MVREAAAFLIYVEKQSPEFQKAQDRLQRKLTKLFNDVAKEMNRQIKNPNLLTNVETIVAPLSEARDEFALIVSEELSKPPSIQLPRAAIERLKDQGAMSASKMINRMQTKIASIINVAQAEGATILDVQGELVSTVRNLTANEIKTIARNEMNLANALRQQQDYIDHGVQFHQWFATLDDVTRESHEDLHLEIVRVGDTFSNGLRYPQDRNGDIGEWINCRCDALPFIMPRGYYPPPGQEQFRESDLGRLQ
jgi:SPP1 gp7 family putative phage head morphogenesis protein